MITVYLMSVEALAQEQTFAGAFQKVDACRQEKIIRAARPEDKRRVLGAGLLLRYAAAAFHRGRSLPAAPEPAGPSAMIPGEPGGAGGAVFRQPAFERVFAALGEPVPFPYRYGPEGKPYLPDGPFFSLSHSGAYVLCAVSGAEVGADIQAFRRIRNDSIIKRCLTAPEAALLENVPSPGERERLFSRLWSAKEAYVKLTGLGLKQNFRTFAADLERGVILENAAPCVGGGPSVPAPTARFTVVRAALAEYMSLPGYSVSVCWQAEKGTR